MPTQFEKFVPGEEMAKLKPTSPETKEPLELTKEQDEHFIGLLQKAKQVEKQGDLEQAIKLFQQYKEEYQALREEKKAKDFEKEGLEALPQKEIKEQYESQKEIFEKNGILEKLSSGEMGIKGIDDKEYAFPKIEEISKMMRENQEILKTKIEQGFTKLLIVPFGMKLDDLIERYKQVILKHHKAGKLLATKKDPSEKDDKLELDKKEPVYVSDEYKNADTKGKLVYYPKEFSKENHQGKTKEEILEKTKQGFNILLIEDLPNIPREGKGQEVGGRKQFETNKTPNEYLEALQTESIYQNEQGLTPEDQIAYAILHLEQTNQVIDDYYFSNGSVSYQLGAFFFASGNVPDADWYRDSRRADLRRNDPGTRDGSYGARSAVRVSDFDI